MKEAPFRQKNAQIAMLAAFLRAAPRLQRLYHSPTAPFGRAPVRILFAGVLGSASAGGMAMCADSPQHAQADELFEKNEYASLVTVLRDGLASNPDDSQLLCRLARALKKQADAAPVKETKVGLLHEALELAQKAIRVEPGCGSAHKWCGIALSSSSSFEGTTASIKNSFQVADHFQKAVALSPSDATSKHLLGLWCYEVAKLTWLERKAAAALFAAPPTSSFEQAYEHFLAAEKTESGLYPKNMLLPAQTCARLGLKDEAGHWHASCLKCTARTPEDEETLAEASKLKL